MMRIENEKNVLTRNEVEEDADHQHQDAEAEDVQMSEHEISQRREDNSDGGFDANASQKILLNQQDRSDIQ